MTSAYRNQTEHLVSYALAKEVTPSLRNRIRLAINFTKDFQQDFQQGVTFSDQERLAVKQLATRISGSADAEKVQSAVFEVARDNGLEPRAFFKLLYKILINSDRGPRLGNYIMDVGVEKVNNKLLAISSSHHP